MKTLHNRLALGSALFLGAIGMAQAVTVAVPGVTAESAKAEQKSETITTGTVSSVSVENGLLAVSGRVYRFSSGELSYSDDRKTPAPGGIEGLKAGTKVTVRSVTRSGSHYAIQVVAKD
jgi:hypothetical protein